MKKYRIGEPEKLLAIINRMDFFKEFSSQEKKAIAELDQYVAFFEQGDVIIKEGDLDSLFYILLLGKVYVIKGNSPHPIANLDPGDCFGEISFLTGAPRTATVIANANNVVAIGINKEIVHELDIKIREKIKDKLINRLVERLDRMNRFVINTKNRLPKSVPFPDDPTYVP